MIRNENISLTLGGGLAVGDFGIEFSDGTAWPLMPIPIVRFNVDASIVHFSFELLDRIKADFTFMPENKIRLTSQFILDPFGVRSIRDLLYDATLWYRFFSKDSKMGDFAGLG